MIKKYKMGEGVVSEKEKAYIDDRLDKFEKILPHFEEDDEMISEIEIYQDKRSIWNVECILQTPRNLYRAVESNHAVTEAFDKVEQMLKKQILRDKKRIKDLRERGGRSIRKKVSLSSSARF